MKTAGATMLVTCFVICGASGTNNPDEGILKAWGILIGVGFALLIAGLIFEK